MLRSAFSTFSGGRGGGEVNMNGLQLSGGMGNIARQIAARNKQLKYENENPEYNHGASTGSFVAGPEVDNSALPVFDGSAPAVPMSPSANSAANTPVFSPEAQESAATVFGTNDQRQTAVTGSKQDTKDKIISELNNL